MPWPPRSNKLGNFFYLMLVGVVGEHIEKQTTRFTGSGGATIAGAGVSCF